MKWLDAWLGSRTATKLMMAKLRVEISILTGHIEAIEARQGDLADRFTRFQNREGMRAARAELGVDTALLAEAKTILGDPGAAIPADLGVAPSKMDLWRKRR